MRIGLFLAYWPWFSPEEQVSLARQADRAGLDSVWVAEAWGQDAVSVLGHLSAVTERVALGSGLMQIPGRTPAMTAMTAATLDVLSGGRFRLGLGVSGPQVSEGWHGVPFSRPLARTREYVEIVRAALAREAPLEYEGEEFRLPVNGGAGLGKPLKLLARPVQERIPIYLGSMGPKAIEQTAQIADGWLPSMFSAELRRAVPGHGRGHLARGDGLRGRGHRARPRPRAPVAHRLPRRDGREGEELLRRGGRALRPGRVRARGAAAVHGAATAPAQRPRSPPELIDSSAVCCRAAELDEHLARYESAGATTFLAMPFGDRPAIVDQLATSVTQPNC